MSTSTVTGMVSSVQVYDSVGSNTYDLKGAFRGFYTELTSLLSAYGDPNKDMIIGGRPIKAKDKYSPYATLLFNTEVSQMESRQETLFNTWTALFQLEKGLSSSSA